LGDIKLFTSPDLSYEVLIHTVEILEIPQEVLSGGAQMNVGGKVVDTDAVFFPSLTLDGKAMTITGDIGSITPNFFTEDATIFYDDTPRNVEPSLFYDGGISSGLFTPGFTLTCGGCADPASATIVDAIPVPFDSTSSGFLILADVTGTFDDNGSITDGTKTASADGSLSEITLAFDGGSSFAPTFGTIICTPACDDDNPTTATVLELMDGGTDGSLVIGSIVGDSAFFDDVGIEVQVLLTVPPETDLDLDGTLDPAGGDTAFMDGDQSGLVVSLEPVVKICHDCNPTDLKLLKLGTLSGIDSSEGVTSLALLVQDSPGLRVEIGFLNSGGVQFDTGVLVGAAFVPYTLAYDDEFTSNVAFTLGEEISGAEGTATIEAIDGTTLSGTLILSSLSGTFTNDELLSGSSGVATAAGNLFGGTTVIDSFTIGSDIAGFRINKISNGDGFPELPFEQVGLSELIYTRVGKPALILRTDFEELPVGDTLAHTLNYDGGTAAFAVGEVVTTFSSGTATVEAVSGSSYASFPPIPSIASGTLTLTSVEGDFDDNDALTGDALGLAVIDGTLLDGKTRSFVPGAYFASGTAPPLLNTFSELCVSFDGDSNFAPAGPDCNPFGTGSGSGFGTVQLTAADNTSTPFASVNCNGSDTDGDFMCNDMEMLRAVNYTAVGTDPGDYFLYTIRPVGEIVPPTGTAPIFAGTGAGTQPMKPPGATGAGDDGFGDEIEKDLFIEIDYMDGHRPDITALNNVIQAFEDSAVEGTIGAADGRGINLHIHVDQKLTHDPDLFVWRQAIDEIHASNSFNNDFKSIKDRNVGFPNIQTSVGAYVAASGNPFGDANPNKRIFIRDAVIDSHMAPQIEGTAIFIAEAEFGKPSNVNRPCADDIADIEIKATAQSGENIPTGNGVMAMFSTGVRATAHPTDDPMVWIFVIEGDFQSEAGKIVNSDIGQLLVNYKLLDEFGAPLFACKMKTAPPFTPVDGAYATTKIIEAHAQLFRYYIWGHNLAGFDNDGKELTGCGGPSGINELPGNDGAVTLGCNWAGPEDGSGFEETRKNRASQGSTNEQAGTFMHELGHSLGLLHNGPEKVGVGQTLTHGHLPSALVLTAGQNIPGTATGCVPQHDSVLSYPRQTDNSIYVGTEFNLDYSHGQFSAIVFNETDSDIDEIILPLPDFTANPFFSPTAKHLAPTLVYGTPTVNKQDVATYLIGSGITINWNQKNPTNEQNLSIDVNNLKIPGCGSSPLEKLVDVDEWTHLNYDLRNVAQGSFNALVPPGELTQEAINIAAASGLFYDGLLKWHGLNPIGFDSDGDGSVDEDPIDFDANGDPIDNDGDGLFNEDPALGDNTIERPGQILNISFQLLSCSSEDLFDPDICIDKDGIIMQAGFYNEQTAPQDDPNLLEVDCSPPEGENPPLVCDFRLLELIDISEIPDSFFFLQVSRISDTINGATSSAANGGTPGPYLETFGEPTDDRPDGEFILFQDEEDDAVGGFYNFYWDTDDSLGPDGELNTGDERDLPGKGTYAVDIMFFDGATNKISIDINDGGAFRQEIDNSITPDPDDPSKGFGDDREASFILIVLKDVGEP